MADNRYHMSDEVDAIMSQLMNELSSWERSTGRKTALLVIPAGRDEKVLVAHDGVFARQEGVEDTVFLLDHFSLAVNQRHNLR